MESFEELVGRLRHSGRYSGLTAFAGAGLLAVLAAVVALPGPWRWLLVGFVYLAVCVSVWVSFGTWQRIASELVEERLAEIPFVVGHRPLGDFCLLRQLVLSQAQRIPAVDQPLGENDIFLHFRC